MKKFTPKATPHVDMTPMVDLFSVVLIFLMLTTNFRVSEPVECLVPASTSEKPLAENDIMTFVIGEDGTVYFNMDNGADTAYAFRSKTLVAVGERYGIEFTDAELASWVSYPNSMGVPMARMKDFLNAGEDKPTYNVGIPFDSANNELASWILCARQVNPNIRAVIKAGSNVPFPKVKEVLDLLQDYKVNNFSLITSVQNEEAKLADE